MADMDEKPGENPYSQDDSETTLAPETKEFAPISARASRANSRNNSRARNESRSIRSLSRIRSNNGYGCDEGDESTEEEGSGGDVEAGRVPVEKDPYEVRWEGGDSDPLNPRSMTMARKWLVVIIVSLSSLCV
jgi:hypothetical protein